MSALEEKVARVICVAGGLDPDFITTPRSHGMVVLSVSIPEWRNYLPDARAAIAAVLAEMEEISEPMLRAGEQHISHQFNEARRRIKAGNLFLAMLAAFKEERL